MKQRLYITDRFRLLTEEDETNTNVSFGFNEVVQGLYLTIFIEVIKIRNNVSSSATVRYTFHHIFMV